MAVYITPVTFEGQHITPSDDGSAWAASMTDGISSGCAMTRSGSTLTIAAGKIVACGRLSRVDDAKTFTVSGSTGFARLVLTIDRSKTVDQQVALDVQTSSTIAGFAALTQDDVNNAGSTYQFALCLIDLTKSGDASIVWKCGRAHSKGFGTQVTIAVADWASNTATKFVEGVTANSNVIVTYAPASQAAWEANGVYGYSQADGTITFKCATTPSAAVTANILLY